jgi:hypothetical protein
MRLERCTHPDCRRPYQVNEFDFGASSPGAARVAEYTCPHCGHLQIAFGHATVLVHALSEEQEEEYNRMHPLPATACNSAPGRQN